MTEAQENNRWHLNKSVPISMILFLLAQTVGLVILAVKLDARVEWLEKQVLRNDGRLVVLESAMLQVIRIDERQQVGLRTLESISKKVDLLIEEMGKQNPRRP